MNRLYLLLLYPLFPVLVTQCQTSRMDSEKTRKIYMEYCSGCHGPKLQKFENVDWKAGKTVGDLSLIIMKGIGEQGMPAYGDVLTEQEIRDLSEYILNYEFTSEDTSLEPASDQYTIETVAEGFGVPWGMEFLPDGQMLVTERSGHLWRIDRNGKKWKINGLPPIRARGQGGLMDIKLHPEYEENGWIYMSYSYIDKEDEKAGNTAIMRARLSEDQLIDQEIIFKATPAVNTNFHFGSRMVFDRDGYLYFTVGDRGKRDEFPQKIYNSNGKVHRINADGSIPTDNPFAQSDDAIASIYSYGHRNPQGIDMHPETGEIWEHEHGPKGGDEINLIRKGENYGWPVISYGINYNGTVLTDITHKEGMQQPLHYYVPSIAPCGMTFVTGDRYPEWKGSILMGSLSFRYLERIQFKGKTVVGQERLLEELDSRVRDVRMSPDGYIYVSVEEPGRILKLVPKEGE